MGIMYRNDDCYNSRERNIVEVIYFEIFELNNTDILEYVSKHYLDQPLRSECENIINADNYSNLSYFNDDEEAGRNFVKAIVASISAKTRRNLSHALWLAKKDAVINLYHNGPEAQGITIASYHTSSIVLSNLGYDGILFAYDDIPKMINEEYYQYPKSNFQIDF